MTARYVITGGAGFIGSNLASTLADEGQSVRVVDNLVTGYWDNLDEHPTVERVTADIRDASALSQAFAGAEVVFHQAALGSVPRSIDNPVETDSVNAGGTVNVLNAARLAGVKRVVFAASSSAYGDTEVLPKQEDMPGSPRSPYAVTKLAAEHYMRVFASIYGLETVALRYFNVFGPRQRPHGNYAAAVPRFVWAAIHNKPITIFGDGEQSRDFCFIKNAVDANLRAARTETKLTGQVINVAGGRRTTLNNLVAKLQELMGSDLNVTYTEPREGDVRHSLADISRAKELLGYEPLVRWEDGIEPTIDYLRSLAERSGKAPPSA